jgi:hypothetical protein
MADWRPEAEWIKNCYCAFGCPCDLPCWKRRSSGGRFSAGPISISRQRRSPARRAARHDLQQRLRPDRNLTGERPVMRRDQQHRGGHAGREQPHRNS